MKFFVFLLLFYSSLSFGYYSVMDSGEIPKDSKINGEIQYLNRDQQLNILGYYETNINEDSSFGFKAGIGTSFLTLGGFFKWTPYPDLSTQPLLGGSIGLFIARIDTIAEWTVRFQPIVSKKWISDWGDFQPYASLPISLRSIDSNFDLPINLALGLNFYHKEMKAIKAIIECGINIDNSYSYISIGAEFPFGKDSPKPSSF